jgi:CBS domain-containing protein
MKLSELFTKGAVTAGPDETLAAVAQRMQQHNVGTVVIVENQRPIGIVTDRDLALALGARSIDRQARVQTVMARRVLAIPDDTGILAATKYIQECAVRRLPVVDREDRVVGIMSLDDLVGLLARELFNLAEGIKHEVEVK